MANLKTITFEEFMMEIGKFPYNLSSIISYYQDIVKFMYKKYGKPYYVKGLNEHKNPDDLELYKKFGIFSDKFVDLDHYIIVYIDPTNEDYRQQYNDFCTVCSVPTHLVVLTDNRETITKVYDFIRNECGNPTIESMQVRAFTSDSKTAVEGLAKRIGTDKLMDISKYASDLCECQGNMAEYIETLDRFVDEIHKKNVNNFAYVGVCPNFIKPHYLNLIEELYLRYGDKFYCSRQDIAIIRDSINKSCLDYDYLMVDEFCKAYDYLPRIFTRPTINDFSDMFYIIKDKSLKLNIVYTEYEDEMSNCQEKEFDYSEIEVYPMSRHFRFNNIVDCIDVKNYILNLYSLLNQKKTERIINCMDLINFKYKNKEMIGLVNNFTLKVNAIAYMPGFKPEENVTLDYEDLLKCLPAGIYLNGNTIAKQLLEPYGFKFSKKLANYQRCNKKLSSAIRKSQLKCRDIVNLIDKGVADLETLGINCTQDLNSRLRFNDFLVKCKGLDFVRSKVDCFAGFNPALIDHLYL